MILELWLTCYLLPTSMNRGMWHSAQFLWPQIKLYTSCMTEKYFSNWAIYPVPKYNFIDKFIEIADLGHYLKENGCSTEHICIFYNGIFNGKFREWIHSPGELHVVDQEKEDLYIESNLHCSGHLHDWFTLVSISRLVCICALTQMYW